MPFCLSQVVRPYPAQAGFHLLLRFVLCSPVGFKGNPSLLDIFSHFVNRTQANECWGVTFLGHGQVGSLLLGHKSPALARVLSLIGHPSDCISLRSPRACYP